MTYLLFSHLSTSTLYNCEILIIFRNVLIIKMKSCTLLILAVTLVIMVVDDVNSVCCYSHFHQGYGYVCLDCTWATPYCGYDKCNLFGCACGGGCRRGSCETIHGKRSLPEYLVNPAEIFSTIDVNG